MNEWISCGAALPPSGKVVMTKIDDADGCRNEQMLKRQKDGRLWFHADGSMYVYYTPTHWRELTNIERMEYVAEERAKMDQKRIALEKRLSSL